MNKQKIFLFVPLAIIAGLLIHTWTIILQTGLIANWRHYLATGFFILLAVLFCRGLKVTLLSTIIFLILGAFNLLTLTPAIITNSFVLRIGSIEIQTPGIQLLPSGLLVLLLIMNATALIEMYLDIREVKGSKNA